MGYDTEADSSTELTEPAGTSVKCAKCQTPAAEADRNIDPSELEELAKDQKYVCHKCKKAQGKMAVNGGLFTADGEKPRLTTSLVMAVSSTAMGTAFPNGYNLGVTNPPEQVIKAFINTSMTVNSGSVPSDVEVTGNFAVIVSAICVGGLVGGLLVLPISKKCARRASLMFNAIFAILGAACMMLSRQIGRHELLILGRIFVGVHAGISGGIAPLYFNELSPAVWRGAVGTIYQLVVVIAILVSQILGQYNVLGNEETWPVLFGGGVLLPELLMLLVLPFCPESPKYLLLERNDESGAEKALKSLRGVSNVKKELKVFKAEAERIRKNPPVKLASILQDKLLRKGFTIACVVMLSQPLSGINAAIFFSTQIFRTAGLSDSHAGLATVGMSVVNLLTTIVSFSIVERSGRRTLLLIGYCGMGLVSIVLMIALATYAALPWMSWVAVVGVLLFIMMFALGTGSIPWFLPTELLPAPAQPLTTGICVALNWTFNIFVGMVFPLLMTLIGYYTFSIFTVFLMGFFIYVWRNLPETKGRTVEEIQAIFRKD